MRNDDREVDDRPSEQSPNPQGAPLPPAVTPQAVALVFLAFILWQFTQASLLASALTFPILFAAVVFLLPEVAGVRPEQVRLTLRRLGRNCLWGVVGWLLLTPVCLALFGGVIALYGSEAASNVREHPFVQMAQHGMSLPEWFLLIFTATVSAAAMEELLFRGAVQSLLEQRVGLSHAIVLTLALLLSIPVKEDGWAAAWSLGGWRLALHLAPVLFMLALVVIYLLVWRLVRRPAAPAIIATSALFAAVHSFAWPAPLPLFVLALGLGWLAHRTRSLVGPVVLHSLFNAVACVELILKVNGVNW